MQNPLFVNGRLNFFRTPGGYELISSWGQVSVSCRNIPYRFKSSSPGEFFSSPDDFMFIGINQESSLPLTTAEYESIFLRVVNKIADYTFENPSYSFSLKGLKRVLLEIDASSQIEISCVEKGTFIENFRYYDDDPNEFNLEQELSASLQHFLRNMREEWDIKSRRKKVHASNGWTYKNSKSNNVKHFVFLDHSLVREKLPALVALLPSFQERRLYSLPRDTVVTYIYASTARYLGKWSREKVSNVLRKEFKDLSEASNLQKKIDWSLTFLRQVLGENNFRIMNVQRPESFSDSSRERSVSSRATDDLKEVADTTGPPTSLSPASLSNRSELKESRGQSPMTEFIYPPETEYFSRLKNQTLAKNTPWEVVRTFPARHILFIELP